MAAPVWLKLVWIRPVRGLIRARQRVHVGALELLQLAVLEDQPGQLVPHRGELLQHVGVGGGAGLGLLEDRELVLLEQHRRELPGRVEVEIHARHRGRSRPRAARRSAASSPLSRREERRSIAMPAHSMSTSTATSGISMSRSSGSTAISRSAGRRTRAGPAPSRVGAAVRRRPRCTATSAKGISAFPCPATSA